MPSDNILTILIPGFKRPLDILFPNGKLPVCKRCKRIFKTRELCRERDGHTDIPWNTTYLCFIFDDSCLAKDSQGSTRIIDEDAMQCRITATLLDEAPDADLYHLKHKEITKPHTPICSLCKKKNYTRYHCREKQNHLHLPWVTFYIKLSTTPYERPDNSLPWPDNALLNNNSLWGNEYDMRHNLQAFKDNLYTVGKSHALLYIVQEDKYHLRVRRIQLYVPFSSPFIVNSNSSFALRFFIEITYTSGLDQVQLLRRTKELKTLLHLRALHTLLYITLQCSTTLPVIFGLLHPLTQPLTCHLITRKISPQITCRV